MYRYEVRTDDITCIILNLEDLEPTSTSATTANPTEAADTAHTEMTSPTSPPSRRNSNVSTDAHVDNALTEEEKLQRQASETSFRQAVESDTLNPSTAYQPKPVRKYRLLSNVYCVALYTLHLSYHTPVI